MGNSKIDFNSLTDEEKKLILEKRSFHIPPPPNNNKLISVDEAEKSYKIKTKKGIFPYIILTIIILFFISLSAIIYFVKMGIVIFVISLFITIPVTLLCLGIMLLKFLVWDRKKLQRKIVVNLSNNFVIANIFKQGMRIDKKVCMINTDGKTITDGKKDYVVDNKGVWVDENKYPNVFVLDNLPNNILFGFADDLNKYVKTLIDKKNIPTTQKGVSIDVSYSSENLQLLKKDKIFAELHRNPDTDKIIMMLIGLVMVISGIFLMIFIFTRGAK